MPLTRYPPTSDWKLGKIVVMTVLHILGIAIVALGVFILVRHPDRPGGVIRIHNMEVSSTGAGLPLIVLGVALVVVTALVPEPGSTTGSSSSDGGGGDVEIPALEEVPQTDCTNQFFAQEPSVDSARVRSVELGADDRRVLGAGESQSTEFGLVLSDTLSAVTPRVLGAVKLSRRSGIGFQVSGMVDEPTCQTVELSLASDPGIPAPEALGDYVWVIFRLENEPYSMLLNSSSGGSEVLVGFVRRGS
jgi:hypothetical protein